MHISLTDNLVTALREEYPFLTDQSAMTDMVEELCWAWLRDRKRTTAALSDRVRHLIAVDAPMSAVEEILACTR